MNRLSGSPDAPVDSHLNPLYQKVQEWIKVPDCSSQAVQNPSLGGGWTGILLLTFCLIVGSGYMPGMAWAQGTGTITGQVVTENGNDALPGVNVLLTGEALEGRRGVSTTNQGRYTFSRVPEGTYSLRASYIGYEPVTVEVSVEAGESVTEDLRLSPRTVRGEEVVVFGSQAQGQAKAFNRQKNAANVKSVIAADQVGRFPDASAPAALQRVSGINVQRDQGEARYVQIRGGAAGMTQVSFNGSNVPSPEGEERQVALDAVPVELLGAIEVNKAITPDMEAEGTGGSVNLETKRPPSDLTFSIEGGPGYGTIRDKTTGKGSVTFGNRFGDFGVLLSGSYNHRRFGSDDVEAVYNLADNPANDQVAEMEQRVYDVKRVRSGASAFLDYAFDANSRVFFEGVFTRLLDDEYQPNLISILEDNAVEFEIAPREETARTLNLAVGGEHLMDSGVNLEYKLGRVKSEEDTPTENTMLFINEGVSFSPSLDGPHVNPDPIEPLAFDEYEREQKLVDNRDLFAQVDLDIPYAIGDMTGSLEFGGKIRSKNATQSVDIFVFGLADGADDILLSDVGSPFSVDNYVPGSYDFPTSTLSANAVNSFTEQNGSQLEREKDVEGDSEDYDILERTTAAYVMTEVSLTEELFVLPGVRFERTRLETEGYSFNADTGEISEANGENTYNQLFPMLHVRYALGDDTNLRAAVTRTLERPNYFFLVPFSIREGNEVEEGNPDLEPMTAVNYDLMFEHYSESVGVLSAGLFAKQLTNPIFISTETETDGTVSTQPRNAASAEIFGFEANLQQQMPFLPGPLDGTAVYANYTYTTSESTLPTGRTSRLPGQTDHTWNFALGYEKYGFSGRVSLNFSGDYIEELGSPLETFYVDNHFQVDASLGYQFTDHVSTSLELVNLNGAPFERYQTRTARKVQQEYYETWGRLSFRYDL